MIFQAISVCCGACAGALCRWGFNCAFNSIFPALPLGTLFVNLAGGLIMGAAMSLFASCPQVPEEWRLLLVTGFLGSFTTFSAFSGEMANLISQGRYVLCAGGIALHVSGSICMVFLGMAAFAFLLERFKLYFL